MQVLHVVMTYDCKENTCNDIKSKKNTHNYIIVYPKILGGQNTLSAHPMSWLGGRLPTLPPRFPRPWSWLTSILFEFLTSRIFKALQLFNRYSWVLNVTVRVLITSQHFPVNCLQFYIRPKVPSFNEYIWQLTILENNHEPRIIANRAVII